MPTPPRTPREWRILLPIPPGLALGDHATHDAWAAEVAPAGWYCVGTIPIGPRDRARTDDPAAWRLRVTYWPEAWRERTTLGAAPAVYATAQIAGVPTRLDGVLTADHDGVQYRTPDGRPLQRQCWWEGAESLPAEVRADLVRLREIDRQRSIGGHGRGRPNGLGAVLTAMRLDEADDAARQAAADRIAAWVRRSFPQVLA